MNFGRRYIFHRQQAFLKLYEKHFNSYSVISFLLHNLLTILRFFQWGQTKVFDYTFWCHISWVITKLCIAFNQIVLSASNYNTRAFIGRLYNNWPILSKITHCLPFLFRKILTLRLPDKNGNNSFSNLLKNNSAHGCATNGFHWDLGLNAGALLNLGVGTNLKPLPKNFISDSVVTFWFKLKTVSTKKSPFNLWLVTGSCTIFYNHSVILPVQKVQLL